MNSTEELPNDKGNSWVELSISNILSLSDTLFETFVVLAIAPWKAREVAQKKTSRPLTFLLVSLLVCGLMIQTVVLYSGRSVDPHVFQVFTGAISTWGAQQLFLVTIPPLLITCGLAGVLARAFRRADFAAEDSSAITAGFCHAVGLQLFLVSLSGGFLLMLKVLSDNQGNDHRFLNDTSLLALGTLIAVSGVIQVERLLAGSATSSGFLKLAGRWTSSFVVSFVGVGAVLAVLSQTFEIERFRTQAAMLGMEEWSGKARILAEIVATRELESGNTTGDSILLEQDFVLTNVSDLPHAVPRPTVLSQFQSKSNLSIIVEKCSIDGSADAGWVIPPGETRLASWTLRVPRQVFELENQLFTLDCMEIDLNRWHQKIERPFSSPQPLFVRLEASTKEIMARRVSGDSVEWK